MEIGNFRTGWWRRRRRWASPGQRGNRDREQQGREPGRAHPAPYSLVLPKAQKIKLTVSTQRHFVYQNVSLIPQILPTYTFFF